MSSYTEIDTALLDLDFTNPRIQNYLQNYPEESRSGELLAMLLGTGTDSCASLKESIKEHGGIINPIIVNHFPDGRYVVIEGNTRLQIYRDFIRDNVPGNWNKIRAIIYENLENNEMHSIRLQAHLVGPRDWDAYAKAEIFNLSFGRRENAYERTFGVLWWVLKSIRNSLHDSSI